MTRVRLLALAGLLIGASLASVGWGADQKAPSFDWSIWRAMVVQHQGRSKPFDTYAREVLLRVTGRDSYRPKAFYTFSSEDVADWSRLAKQLSNPPANSPAGFVASKLPAELRQQLADTPFDELPALLEQWDKAWADLMLLRKNSQEGRGGLANADRWFQLMEDEGGESAQVIQRWSSLKQKIEHIGQVQSETLIALNDLVAWKDLSTYAVWQDTKLGPLADELRKSDPSSLPTPRLAFLNHRLIESAFPEALRDWKINDNEYFKRGLEDREYSATEVVASWILTHRGWDLKNEQFDSVQDFVAAWQNAGRKNGATPENPFDFWDRAVMINARYEPLHPWAMPETKLLASPLTVRRLDTSWPNSTTGLLEAWLHHTKEFRETFGEDLKAGEEEKGESALQANHGYLEHRTGLHARMLPVPFDESLDVSHDRNQVWIPIPMLMRPDGLAQSAGFDLELSKSASEGFYKAREALLNQDVQAFNEGSQQLADALQSMGVEGKSLNYPKPQAMALELHYNQLDPFKKTAMISFLATLVLAFGLGVRNPWPTRAGVGLVWAGLGMTVWGLGLRVYISGRPPVTNMFETIIWAAVVATVLGLIMGMRTQNRIVSLASAILLTLSTLLASIMPAHMGATITPLQAVLRSHYWLIVHVLTIVASYGAFMLTWILGNIGLAHYLVGKTDSKTIKPIAQFAYRSMQVGVILLAAGTILGGVWAAYSWGRFWGWDAKEVWALIALLGYLAIMHARLAGLIKNFGFLVCSTIGFLTVVMAWYGVNFVFSAGMHAYALGEGGQPYVFSAIAANLAFVLTASLFAKLRGKPNKPAKKDDFGLPLENKEAVVDALVSDSNPVDATEVKAEKSSV